MSLRKRITLFAIVFNLAVSSVIGLVFYQFSVDGFYANFQNQVLLAARALSGAIDGDSHARIARQQAANDAAYRFYLAYFNRIKKSDPSISYLYTIHHDREKNRWQYVVDADLMERDMVWFKSDKLGFALFADDAGRVKIVYSLVTNSASFDVQMDGAAKKLRIEGLPPHQSVHLGDAKLLTLSEHAPELTLETSVGVSDRRHREITGTVLVDGKPLEIFYAFTGKNESQSIPGELYVETPELERKCREIMAGGVDTIVEKEARTSIYGENNFTAYGIIRDAAGIPNGLVCLDVYLSAIERFKNSLIGLTAIASAVAFVVTLLMSLLLAETVVRPVRRLDEVVRRVTDGNLDVRLEVRGSDEFAHLASGFNHMTSSLRQFIAENGRLAAMEQEMAIARRIQNSILPLASPVSSRYDIAYKYIPMQSVGGDFFGFHIISETRIGMIISDVSGHGVPAALIGAMVKMAFEFEHANAGRPQEMLQNMNRLLLDMCHTDEYVTACYVYLDLEQRRLYTASGGHPPLIVFRRSTDNLELIKPKGPLIGWFPSVTCESVAFDLEPGDRIVLYTDGIIEAHAPDNRMYGEVRFYESIKAAAGMTAAACVERVVTEVRSWTGNDEGFEDDLTIVVVDVK